MFGNQSERVTGGRRSDPPALASSAVAASSVSRNGDRILDCFSVVGAGGGGGCDTLVVVVVVVMLMILMIFLCWSGLNVRMSVRWRWRWR